MSCQTSLESAKEFIQLINHLLHWSAVLSRGLESWHVVCRRCCFCFSFYQQLLLPVKLSITLQLSANKSSDLLPAFSHPLSQPGSCFGLCLSSLNQSLSSSTLCFLLCLPIYSKHSSDIFSLSRFLFFSLNQSFGSTRDLPPHAATAALLTRRTRRRHFIHN